MDLSKLTLEELKEYLKSLDKQSRRDIEKEIEKYAKELAQHPEIKRLFKSSVALLSLQDLETIHNIVVKMYDKTTSGFEVIINTTITKGLRAGEEMHRAECQKSVSDKMFDLLKEREMFKSRQGAMGAHQSTRKGFTKAMRVWRGAVSDQVELTIQLALAEGSSADNLARQLIRYLKEPDRLYRRYHMYKRDAQDKIGIGKNKTVEIKRRVIDPVSGRAKWVTDAEPYKPGRGVYKSSYKNALRMARNELTKAYKAARIMAMRSDAITIGYHISLSNNHTRLNSDGQAIPYTTEDDEICDFGTGDYPLDWMWTNWHVQCRCDASPVFAPKEYTDYLERCFALKIEPEIPKSAYYVLTLPRSFIEWVHRNKHKLHNLPDWIIDNPRYRPELGM